MKKPIAGGIFVTKEKFEPDKFCRLEIAIFVIHDMYKIKVANLCFPEFIARSTFAIKIKIDRPSS